jgi:hypothetical protein
VRYFSYDGPVDTNEILKQRLKDLTADQYRANRKSKWFSRLGKAAFWVVSVGVIILLAILTDWEMPEKNLLDVVAMCVVQVLRFVLCPCVGALVGALAATFFFMRAEDHTQKLRREILHDACSHLRSFYGVREPLMVTKCYTCTDPKFSRHDVCLFWVEDELRITTNLVNGFIHPQRDLGCYAAKAGEITMTDAVYKDRAALELGFGDVTFCISANAKPFLKLLK